MTLIKRIRSKINARKTTVIKLDGYILKLAPNYSLLESQVYQKKSWEPKMTSRIQQEITPGMVVVDVGAHIGYHTILFSKLVKDNGRVLAFEPSRREFNLLYENVKINEASNTKVFNIALYDKVSEMSLDRDQLVIDAQETLVKTDTLDNVITNEHVAKVDLIKIDVEGAELKILIGSKQILTSMHPRLLIEVHPSKLVDFNDSLEELQTLLQDLGYSIEEFDSDPSIHWFCQVKA